MSVCVPGCCSQVTSGSLSTWTTLTVATTSVGLKTRRVKPPLPCGSRSSYQVSIDSPSPTALPPHSQSISGHIQLYLITLHPNSLHHSIYSQGLGSNGQPCAQYNYSHRMGLAKLVRTPIGWFSIWELIYSKPGVCQTRDLHKELYLSLTSVVLGINRIRQGVVCSISG